MKPRRILGAGILGLTLASGLAACSVPIAESVESTDSTAGGSAAVDASTTDETTPNTDADTAATTEEDAATDETTAAEETIETASGFADGEYTATGAYTTPGGRESVDVTVTLEDGIVTTVAVSGSADRGDSQRYQSEFIANITSQVVGVPIDELDVTKVAGSSLTSDGFNEAISQILAEAQA